MVTLWVNEGDPIANSAQKIDSGYRLVSLNTAEEERFDPITSSNRKFEVQTVTIAKGEKSFTLGQNKIANDTDYTITLIKDFGDKGDIVLQGDQEFRLGDKVYRVASADKEALKVVIRCEADKKEVTLTSEGALQ